MTDDREWKRVVDQYWSRHLRTSGVQTAPLPADPRKPAPRLLFLSREGTLACMRHAPAPGSAQREGEGWRRVPEATLAALAANGRRAAACEFCVAERRARAEARR